MNEEEIIESFSEAWPENRNDYSREEDKSWIAYGLALKNIILSGNQDIHKVEEGLKHPNRQVRALCARALGFIGSEDTVESLKPAITGDSWETVRLSTADTPTNSQC